MLLFNSPGIQSHIMGKIMMRQCRGVPIKKILLEGGEEYEVRIFLKDLFERLTRVTDDVHSYNSLVFLMYCSFFVPFLW